MTDTIKCRRKGCKWKMELLGQNQYGLSYKCHRCGFRYLWRLDR